MSSLVTKCCFVTSNAKGIVTVGEPQSFVQEWSETLDTAVTDQSEAKRGAEMKTEAMGAHGSSYEDMNEAKNVIWHTVSRCDVVIHLQIMLFIKHKTMIEIRIQKTKKNYWKMW